MVRAIPIIILLTLSVLCFSKVYATPSISETKQAVQRSLQSFVPYSTELRLNNITVKYRQEKRVITVANIVCYPENKGASIHYDNGLIYLWDQRGQAGVDAVIAHELSHCNPSTYHQKDIRELEMAADYGAVDFFHKAKRDLNGVLVFLYYLQEVYGYNVGNYDEHYPDSVRIDKIKQYAKQRYGVDLR